MPNRNLVIELEETENVALIARQRGEQSRLVPQGLCPPGGAVRAHSVKEQGVVTLGSFS